MNNSFITSVESLMLRDLDTLEREIIQYPTIESIWTVRGDIKNTAGNLCLHLCGNLQHFIGAILGQSGYIRDREKEFALKNISAKELVSEVIRTKESIKAALQKLEPAVLDKEYPIAVFNYPMTTQYFLIHLSAHLGYHLGQINYHRRLVGI